MKIGFENMQKPLLHLGNNIADNNNNNDLLENDGSKNCI